MLGKLIRYDAKIQFKFLGGVSLICLIISLFAGITGKLSDAYSKLFILDMLSYISFALWILSMILMVCGVFIYAVVFFRRNLFRDEGYLMHTIPVTETQLFMSKLLTSTLAVYASFVVAFVCLCLATMRVDFYIDEIKALIPESGVIGGGAFWTLTIASLILSVPSYLCQFFASIAIGYTWKIKSGKHVNRDLLSVAVFAILYVIQQVLGLVQMFGYFFVWLKPFEGGLEERLDAFMMSDVAYAETELMDYLQGILGMSLAFTIIMSVVLVWLSLRKMNRQLNLE